MSPPLTQTQGLTNIVIASISLLDLYLLQSSSCVNAGINTTLPSSAVMDGQTPSKGDQRGSLSTIEGLVEAYAASVRSDDSHAFIHAGELDRQSYIDARRQLAALPAPLLSPGPAPSPLRLSSARLPTVARTRATRRSPPRQPGSLTGLLPRPSPGFFRVWARVSSTPTSPPVAPSLKWDSKKKRPPSLGK
jgi:hypothetical protein